MAPIRMIAAASVVAALSGCAHQISLSTDESKVPALSTQPLDKNVAIVITDEQSTQESSRRVAAATRSAIARITTWSCRCM